MRFFEHYKRSIGKALTFRIVILVVDFLVINGITKRADIALGYVLFSSFTHTILYFFHERMWNGIHWGKKHKK